MSKIRTIERGAAGGWTDARIKIEIEPPADGSPRVAQQVFTTVSQKGDVVPRSADLMTLLSSEYFELASSSSVLLRTKPASGGALQQQLAHLTGVIEACADKAGLVVRAGMVEYLRP